MRVSARARFLSSGSPHIAQMFHQLGLHPQQALGQIFSEKHVFGNQKDINSV